MSGANRLDQALAVKAHQIVGDTVNPVLRTRLRQLPAQLRGGGLCATYAHLMAQAAKGKSDDGTDSVKEQLAQTYRRLTEKIAEHVYDLRLLEQQRNQKPAEFLRALASADVTAYARTCAEVEALSIWTSRLADARYEPDEADNG